MGANSPVNADPPAIAEPTPGNFYVGVGRSDVTGPIAQVNMVRTFQVTVLFMQKLKCKLADLERPTGLFFFSYVFNKTQTNS